MIFSRLVLFLLTLSSLLLADGSGTFSWRARENYHSGNLERARSLYNDAFIKAQKEADRARQNQVLANITHLEIDQLMLNTADSILIILENREAPATMIQPLRVRLGFLRGQCPENSFSENPSISLLFYSTLCAAQAKDFSSAEAGLQKLAEKLDGEESGMYNTAAGWILAYQGRTGEALEKWDIAVKRARNAGQYVRMTDLLWYQYQLLKKVSPKRASIELQTSAEVALRTGAPLLFYRAARFLSKKDYPEWDQKVQEMKKEIEPLLPEKVLNFPEF